MTVHDTQNPETREDALAAAVDAVRGGRLIVLPTDTVYGIGADAFTPDAVQALLEAKGRGRDTPPPVLIGDHAVLLALATDVPDYVEDLTDELWPGALTLILTAQPSLTWDLGETRGTVALRMPDDEVALELLRSTGPLAVSSANRHARPAALSVLDAATQLGDSVEIYLDGGPAPLGESSTILDTTVTPAEIVREGAISKERIIEVVGDIFTAPEPEPAEEDDESAADSDTADDSTAGDGTADDSTDDGSTADDSAAGDTAVDVRSPADDSVTDGTAEVAAAGGEGAHLPTAPDTTQDSAPEPTATPAAEDPAATAPVLDLPSEPDTTVPLEQAPPAETPLEGLGDGSGASADAGDAAERSESSPG
ncbi:L-threonylcarbamoyladenylate synthase [Brachybacterium sp. AOP43-C2-M15]|uniref:L-threonylcarbamoyladenylate synthase n=1 Tax=Brachybacterium sp. AOP43-C2-M15 TaxID=3457661 RepID=UPI004034A302